MLSIIGDVPIESKAHIVTAQSMSFIRAHRGLVLCVLVGLSMRVLWML